MIFTMLIRYSVTVMRLAVGYSSAQHVGSNQLKPGSGLPLPFCTLCRTFFVSDSCRAFHVPYPGGTFLQDLACCLVPGRSGLVAVTCNLKFHYMIK